MDTKRRKYSIFEIDRMRIALRARRRFISLDTALEDELRTIMLNGSTPEEVEAAVDKTEDASILADIQLVKERNGPRSVVMATNSRGDQLTA